METILSSLSLLCGFLCFLLNLFTVRVTQHFTFEDLKSGATGVHEAVRAVNRVSGK